MPLDDLINVIETLKERMTMYCQSLQQNEIRTRTALIDPLLTALGWDVSDPGLVTPEYTVGQGRADYALIDGGSRSGSVAIVEAKSLDSFLNDRERNQMLIYANMEGVKYAILTNGDRWELYDIFTHARLNERRLLSVKIINTPAHQLALQLLLLWRPNLTSGQPVTAQGPALGTETERITAEALHQPVDTPLPQTGSAPPLATHQSRQGSSSSRTSRYCVAGETWLEFSNATLCMISIVEWCARKHVRGEDDYYESLSRVCYGSNPILIREKVTEQQNQYYYKEEINGWYIYKSLGNPFKKIMIDQILEVCIGQGGISPVRGRDLQVEMPNA